MVHVTLALKKYRAGFGGSVCTEERAGFGGSACTEDV